MIKLKRNIYDAIVKQAQRDNHIEVCGYLAGINRKVTRHFEMTNTDQSIEHYSLDPKEQFEVLKKTRKSGLEIIAVYHSHPETPARMSDEDIRLANDPKISYVIVSLADRVNIKSFKVTNKIVTNENIEVID